MTSAIQNSFARRFSFAEADLVRLTGLFVLGLLSGLFWLSYTVDVPGQYIRPEPLIPAEVHRMLRLLFPLTTFLFTSGRLTKRILYSMEGILLLTVFFALPCLSLAIMPRPTFAIYAVGPIIIAGSLLLCLMSLEKNSFESYCAGVSCAAFIFLGSGLAAFGFDSSRFYMRSRIHLGMDHPIATCSMLIGSATWLFLVINRLGAKHLSTGLRRSLNLLVFGLLTLFIELADSRNIRLALAGFAATYLMMQLKLSLGLKRLLLLLIGCFPVALYALSYANGLGRINVPAISSRIGAYFSVVHGILNGRLLGPSGESAQASFSQIESVYLSYGLLFGRFSLVVLMIFYMVLGFRLLNRKHNLAIALWASLLIFYTFDAQGITDSNLIFFLFLAYLIRQAFLSSESPARDTIHG